MTGPTRARDFAEGLNVASPSTVDLSTLANLGVGTTTPSAGNVGLARFIHVTDAADAGPATVHVRHRRGGRDADRRSHAGGGDQ